MPVFALMNRGLEAIGAAEISALPETRLTQVAYRRIEVECAALSPLLKLRTVDDVFIQLATWPEVGHERRWLALFADLSAQLQPGDFLPAITGLRSIPPEPRFSVTVNFVGKRNYSAPEVKIAVAEGISRRHSHWSYVDDDRDADLNFRVFIEHQTALVGLRVGANPLHRRAYQSVHQPGALKPVVAAAMLQCAGVQPGARVVDPFCGSGTILIEAALVGATAIGGDVESDSIHGAMVNSQQAGISMQVYHGDARQIPLPDGFASCVISNLPWGRQVQVDDQLTSVYRRAFAEMQRITSTGGRIVLLTTFPDLLGEQPAESLEISLFGQNPHIVIFTAGT